MNFMYLYALSDFETIDGNIIPPKESGAMAAGTPNFKIMLKADAVPTLIEVTDTDSNPDTLGELGNGQTLTNAITLNSASGDPVTYAAGTTLRGNYFLTDDADDPALELASITLGEANTGNNTTHAVAFFGQPVPGQQYCFQTEINYNGNQRPYDEFLLCFAKGAQIATLDGIRLVEDLRIGDMIPTRDDGPLPIGWIGSRTIFPRPGQHPIEFAPSAIGNTSALQVSPQHRVLITGWQAELLFGCNELLVPAKAMVNDTNIRPVDLAAVTYYHVMFDRHTLLLSNGCWTESLLYSAESMAGLTLQQRDEIENLFPDLAPTGYEACTPFLKMREGTTLS